MKHIQNPDQPIILTVNGNAEDAVPDTAASARIIASVEHAEMFEFLREAKLDADAGRNVPARAFLQSLGKT